MLYFNYYQDSFMSFFKTAVIPLKCLVQLVFPDIFPVPYRYTTEYYNDNLLPVADEENMLWELFICICLISLILFSISWMVSPQVLKLDNKHVLVCVTSCNIQYITQSLSPA